MSFSNLDIIQKSGNNVFIIVILFMILTLFLNETDIKNNEFLISAINIFDGVFFQLERFALLANSADLYYKAKLTYVYGTLMGFFAFVVTLFLYGRIYFCSLNIVQCKKKYIDHNIKQNGVRESILILLAMWIFTLILFDFTTLGYYSQNFAKSVFITIQSEFGILFFSIIVITCWIVFAYLIIASLSHLYKFINR